MPPARWDVARYYDADKNKPGAIYCKWGGFIEGADEFDAAFFNITPREAEVIDPQERLFLQCAFAALEDAGLTRETLGGGGRRVGVYVGVGLGEYGLFGAELQAQGIPLGLAGSPASIANRVSYVCNFQGPRDRKSTRLNSSHIPLSRMPSSA